MNVPLADSAVLRSAKQKAVFEVKVVDLIDMTNQRSKLVNFVSLKV